MRSLRSTAGAVAAVLAVGAIGVVGAGAAHAATTVQETGLQLFGQVNNNGLSGVQNLEPTGTPDNTAGHTLTVTVSPSTSVIAGSPISITISSPTLTICNGPAAAAAAKGEELDAVVVVAGKQYLLRGPQNSSAVPASTFQNANHASCVHPLFNTGWVVSSTPGGSSATSDTTATAATHGLGTATPTAPSTVVALTAPTTAGTFSVAVKGLVVNSLTAPATAALTDPFDEFVNLDNGGHSAADVNGVSYCDNSATCANGYAGPGGIAGDATDSPNGVGSFLANDPGMYLSAASATPPAMTTANYLGTTVDNPTARDLGLPASTTWTPIVLTVAKDTTKPVVTLTVPSKANVGASWATVRGTVKDTGTGPKAVYVQLVDAKGKAYSSWSGSKWVKASSRTAALKAAKKLTATPSSSGAWSVKGAKPPKGTTLTVSYYAVDKAGNTAAAKTYSKAITA